MPSFEVLLSSCVRVRRVDVFFVVENVESIVVELLNGPVLRH